MREIAPTESILKGIFTTLVVSIVTIAIAMVLLEVFLPNVHTAIKAMLLTGVIVVCAGYVFGSSLHNIPVAHRGIPLFLGKRVSSTALLEGWQWVLPPPFGNVVILDTRERSTTNDDQPEESIFMVGNYPKNNGESVEVEQARMVVLVTIQWKIKYIDKVLDVTEEVISNGLHDLMASTIRSFTNNWDPMVLIGKDGEIAEAILNVVAHNPIDGTQTQSERWGIEVINVNVRKIDFVDPETRQAYELLTREKRQTAGEQEELDNVVRMIKKLVKTGLTPQAAANVVQSERKKATMNIHQVTGDAPPIVKAAAVHGKN